MRQIVSLGITNQLISVKIAELIRYTWALSLLFMGVNEGLFVHLCSMGD